MQKQYQAQQLASLLKSLQGQQASGALYLTSQPPRQQQRTRVLVLIDGNIVYGGSEIPSSDELVQKIGQKFKPDLIKVALDLAKQKVKASNSVQELLAALTKMRVLTWEQIETYISSQVVLTLEQVLPYPGQVQLDSKIQFDLNLNDGGGLDWSKLLTEISRRREEWAALAPQITSMEAVPRLSEKGLQKSDQAVRKHLQRWVDGKRSLVEIATGLNKDPLQVARSYLNWSQMDWVVFDVEGSKVKQNDVKDSTPKSTTRQVLPTVLSVDDSPIVQTAIKRAIGDRYNLLLADNAVDALSLLNQKPVSLLLLDLTMPDIDGLDMCMTLRKIPKFRKLPVIMLTARDGHINKLKGQIAGTNHYLTKPFDKEELLKLIEQYV